MRDDILFFLLKSCECRLKRLDRKNSKRFSADTEAIHTLGYRTFFLSDRVLTRLPRGIVGVARVYFSSFGHHHNGQPCELGFLLFIVTWMLYRYVWSAYSGVFGVVFFAIPRQTTYNVDFCDVLTWKCSNAIVCAIQPQPSISTSILDYYHHHQHRPTNMTQGRLFSFRHQSRWDFVLSFVRKLDLWSIIPICLLLSAIKKPQWPGRGGGFYFIF